jgi:CDP-4-dehydro-6-deoxyglucose reductase, E1
MEKSIYIKKGKNIIDFSFNSNNSYHITFLLNDSKNNSDNILFYNKKTNKLLNTYCQYINWYNEVSDSIHLSCKIKNISELNMIYYSNKTKKITYQYISKKEIDIDKDDIMEKNKQDLFVFQEKMDKKFKTNKDKIKELVELELKINNEKDEIFKLPLSEKTYDHNEINAMLDVLLGDKLTMGKNVEEFEKEFATYIGSQYAIMVNSGSSANLLAMAVLSNFKYKNKLNKGDKIIVPTICWSTSVWPIIQMGLEPIFVDININTLNADIDKIEELLKNNNTIRGIMAVHILGNTTNMDKLMKLKSKYNLILMEDTCESLGTKYNNQYLGTFGECGTYSFYFSHHITTIEGGMVVTDDFEIYELLKCLRAHGWSRGITGYNSTLIDSRFCFINVGYNLRPMEIQAAMGLIQLKRLTQLNKNRIHNYEKVINLLKESKTDKFNYFKKEENSEPAWFALPFILNKKYNKKNYLKYLENNGIDTRPIVTGNFTRQPVFKDLNININASTFVNSEIIHENGFFIGLPSYKMNNEKIQKLIKILIDY